jgi:hypothetical protein
MFIVEFNSKFVTQEEGGVLFQVMRKLSQLDPETLQATEMRKWGEWPPDSPDDPDGSVDPEGGIRVS